MLWSATRNYSSFLLAHIHWLGHVGILLKAAWIPSIRRISCLAAVPLPSFSDFLPTASCQWILSLCLPKATALVYEVSGAQAMHATPVALVGSRCVSPVTHFSSYELRPVSAYTIMAPSVVHVMPVRFPVRGRCLGRGAVQQTGEAHGASSYDIG